MTREIIIRIQVPDGVAVPDVDYRDGGNEPPHPAAQAGSAPSCPAHGPMNFKQGTNKAGKPYAGHFCFAEGCETPPVWSKTR